MLGNLQSLRFIFALMIFLHHYPVNGVGLFGAGGSCGVSFFLILSGFVMALGYYDKAQHPDFSYRSYITKRIVRIYPVHILCLLLFILLNLSRYIDDSCLLIKLIPNALLLQSWTSDYFSGNAVSWCLCDMLFFYLLFPYIARLLAKLKPNHIIGLIIIGAIGYALLLKYLPSMYNHRVLYISPLLRLVDFVWGIVLYQLYQYIKSCSFGEQIRHLSFTTKTIIEVVVVGLLVIQIYFYPLVPKQFIYASYWWLIMASIILVFALFDNYRGGGYIPCVVVQIHAVFRRIQLHLIYGTRVNYFVFTSSILSVIHSFTRVCNVISDIPYIVGNRCSNISFLRTTYN